MASDPRKMSESELSSWHDARQERELTADRVGYITNFIVAIAISVFVANFYTWHGIVFAVVAWWESYSGQLNIDKIVPPVVQDYVKVGLLYWVSVQSRQLIIFRWFPWRMGDYELFLRPILLWPLGVFFSPLYQSLGWARWSSRLEKTERDCEDRRLLRERAWKSLLNSALPYLVLFAMLDHWARA